MSTDYAEKEREFLSTLEEDSGRDLAAWMAAIEAQGLPGKNEIIDWLRQQGFMFWKASWLERIHANGGRPIYGHGVSAGTAGSGRSPAEPPPPQPAPPRVADAERLPASPSPAVASITPRTADDPDLEALLAKAKALQPLARHVLKEIAKHVPGCGTQSAPGHVSLSNHAGREFGVLVVGPKELRLGLALGDAPLAHGFAVARFVAPGLKISPAMTHMAALADVRQVTAELLVNVAKAAEKAGQ